MGLSNSKRINCDPNTKLSDFIRNHARLKGTKVTCEEGGCGTCMVTITRRHPVTDETSTYAINSCLCPIYSIANCNITTVEGLGSQRTGFHPFQNRIASYNGSQCGYCTPGMVMSMHGLFCSKTAPSLGDVENNFDGNLCRCTGYRPILDSAKSFVQDTTKEQSILDIEELCKFKCPKVEYAGNGAIPKLEWEGKFWYGPRTIEEAFQICTSHQGLNTAFVCGNTAGDSKCDVHVDIRNIKDLYKFKISKDSLDIGSNWSISELIDKLKVELRTEMEGRNNFKYLLKTIIPHFKKVAGTPVRNAGTWAGNLMLKHNSPGFPSDIYIALDAIQAKLHIVDKHGIKEYLPEAFLNLDMTEKLIVSMSLPGIDPSDERFQTFKVMPRAANTFAIVNAGFYVKLEKADQSYKIKDIRIAFGGLGKQFLRAKKTEATVTNKVFCRETFKDACKYLKTEAMVEEGKTSLPPKYRLDIARNLLFLFLKNACDHQVNIEQFYLNTSIDRQLSTASYDYEEKEEKYPYCQPLPKIDSVLQASGEAEFTGDKPTLEGELQAVTVLSEYAKAKLQDIDYSQALLIPGVHSVITAENMTGTNIDCTLSLPDNKPVVFLADKEVEFAGQPVAIVLGETKLAAETAAKKVKVTYTDIPKPIIDLEEAIEKNYCHIRNPTTTYVVRRGNAEDILKQCDQVIDGQVKTESQYHFYMENVVSLCVPYDDLMNAYVTCQYPALVQQAIAGITGKPNASINVQVLRVGGGFGGKLTSAKIAGSLCAIAANTANRPVRCHFSLKDCMRMYGKRYPVLAKYKVGISKTGRMEAIVMDIYVDTGYIPEIALHYFSQKMLFNMENAYNIPNWKLESYVMKTDKQSTFAMRSPDQLPAHFIMETVVDHVANILRKDVLLYKELHFLKDGDSCIEGGEYRNVEIQKIWDELHETASIQSRLKEIEQFNQISAFLKRGLSIVPTKFIFSYNPCNTYNVYLSVYASDGTVAITHGAIEMGQGINTKVIQVAAKELGILKEKIKVYTTATLTSPNNTGTHGSNASENVCRSVLEACKVLNEKMKQHRTNTNVSWDDLVTKCNSVGIDLSVSYRHNTVKNSQGSYAYCIYAASAVEVELDVLTGQSTILRLDGIFDIGESANPTIDLGQIEGALIMGFGFYRSEREIYDKDTGKLLNPGTLKYYPPTAMDIPIQMNIKLKKNCNNEYGVMPSKAIGEPPMLASTAVLFAMKRAIESYRHQKGDHSYFALNQPATVNVVQELCQVTMEDLVNALPE